MLDQSTAVANELLISNYEFRCLQILQYKESIFALFVLNLFRNDRIDRYAWWKAVFSLLKMRLEFAGGNFFRTAWSPF